MTDVESSPSADGTFGSVVSPEKFCKVTFHVSTGMSISTSGMRRSSGGLQLWHSDLRELQGVLQTELEQSKSAIPYCSCLRSIFTINRRSSGIDVSVQVIVRNQHNFSTSLPGLSTPKVLQGGTLLHQRSFSIASAALFN